MRRFLFAPLLMSLVLMAGCLGAAGQSKCQYLDEYGLLTSDQCRPATYEQAVSSWGPPSSMTKLENIFVVQWVWERGRLLRPESLAKQAETGQPDKSYGYEFIVTFDNQTQKLTKWRYRQWP
ncbi:MAG: hypothetical protein AB1641_22650 [Thermodesulfobacteriota bacterium]